MIHSSTKKPVYHQWLANALTGIAKKLSTCESGPLTADTEGVSELVCLLELILKHGLRQQAQGVWPVLSTCGALPFDSSPDNSVLAESPPLENSKSDGRLIDWLHRALDKGFLASVFASIVTDPHLLHTYYDDRAFLRNDEYSFAISSLLFSFNSMKFTIGSETDQEVSNTIDPDPADYDNLLSLSSSSAGSSSSSCSEEEEPVLTASENTTSSAVNSPSSPTSSSPSCPTTIDQLHNTTSISSPCPALSSSSLLFNTAMDFQIGAMLPNSGDWSSNMDDLVDSESSTPTAHQLRFSLGEDELERQKDDFEVDDFMIINTDESIMHQTAANNNITIHNNSTKVPKEWVNDSKSCMLCGSSFSLIFRRHHCRACGKMLCAGCSAHKAILEECGSTPVRVCTPCYSSAPVACRK
eukprot:TRINITY_DN2404_c0_g1_i1.p1 TRINITY_DN2404_c0_g1~~TRINITY_DN2404_c0_g1_i1.p1  ORF type:complete len:412 (-),score=96.75 TRINITY_DN2404_c0_g1_i1:150-1385(-)